MNKLSLKGLASSLMGIPRSFKLALLQGKEDVLTHLAFSFAGSFLAFFASLSASSNQ